MTIDPAEGAPPPSDPPAVQPRAAAPFPLPAAYYSNPTPSHRPLFPAGLVAGCGVASIVLLLVLFAGAAAFSKGGGGSLVGAFFSTMRHELDGIFAADVPQAERTAFDAEYDRFARNVGEGALPLDKVQPFLGRIRDVASDQTFTRAEVEQVTGELRSLNASARPRPRK